MSEETALASAELIPLAKAQLRQDILVAAIHGFKRDGYFVEIGATDGLYLSNTLLLERELGWSGILAEPARYWHDTLRAERKAAIETRCVHKETGRELLFREVSSDQALSTIVDYAKGDLHQMSRKDGTEYSVGSISLLDLLVENNAPYEISFLSLDTEGSEFDILESFDFDAYRFGAITCEHNYTSSRVAVLRLLKANGYVRILNHISQFDDWYVHESKLPALRVTLPDWESVSDQSEKEGTRRMSENERTIKMLQETVQSLILDRDAYKSAMEARIVAEANGSTEN